MEFGVYLYLYLACHLHIPRVKNPGSLNFLEPSEPIQTSIGTDLPYILPLFKKLQSLSS